MEKSYGSVKIKAAWFDHKNKKRKILDLGYKGLYLYLILCTYRLKRANMNEEFLFYTSISKLRKRSKYTTEETVKLLKLLISKKIIKLKEPSRWDRINDKELIVFSAIDVPQTSSIINDKKKRIDQPKSDEDIWISVDLDLIEFYKEIGLGDKFLPLHCLMSKLSNGLEQKAFMSIMKMAETLGIHHDTIHNRIKTMNEKNVLCSFYKSNRKGGKNLEHKICKKIEGYAEFLEIYKDTMDRNTERWKSKEDIRNIEFIGEDDDNLDFEEGEFEELQESDDFKISSLSLGTGFGEHQAAYH